MYSLLELGRPSLLPSDAGAPGRQIELPPALLGLQFTGSGS